MFLFLYRISFNEIALSRIKFLSSCSFIDLICSVVNNRN
jgi:hypothetical protein